MYETFYRASDQAIQAYVSYISCPCEAMTGVLALTCEDFDKGRSEALHFDMDERIL